MRFYVFDCTNKAGYVVSFKSERLADWVSELLTLCTGRFHDYRYNLRDADLFVQS